MGIIIFIEKYKFAKTVMLFVNTNKMKNQQQNHNLPVNSQSSFSWSSIKRSN